MKYNKKNIEINTRKRSILFIAMIIKVFLPFVFK
jgi:hypothetical protein